MPKTWLSLPEAERLAVDFTGSDVAGARGQILEGIRNREIHTSGRSPNGLRISSLPGEAWAQDPDWETSHLRWSPRRLYGERLGRVIVGLIDRRTLERYLAPVGLVSATRKPAPPAKNKGGRPPKIPQRVIREAMAWLYENGVPERQATLEEKIQTLLKDAGLEEVAPSTARDEAVAMIAACRQAEAEN